MSVGVLNDTVQKARLHHIQWNPDACTKHHKGICKEYIRPEPLILVVALLLDTPMNTQQQIKVMQIWIMIVVVGVTVMRIRVLVLPHDGIAQQGHAPKTNVIDKRRSGRCKVASIVPKGTNQPPKDSKQKGANQTPLM